MATPSNYEWRRDKDGRGVWEHRGKVAVAGLGLVHKVAQREQNLLGSDNGTFDAGAQNREKDRLRVGGTDARRVKLIRDQRFDSAAQSVATSAGSDKPVAAAP